MRDSFPTSHGELQTPRPPPPEALFDTPDAPPSPPASSAWRQDARVDTEGRLQRQPDFNPISSWAALWRHV